MFKSFYLLIFVLFSSLVSTNEIELYFIEPKDGAAVNGPVKIIFGLFIYEIRVFKRMVRKKIFSLCFFLGLLLA